MDQNSQNQNQNSQNQNQNQDNNQQDSNTNLLDGLWYDEENNQGGDQNLNNQQSSENNLSIEDHIKSLGLTEGVDLHKLQEDLSEGKVDSLNEALSAVAAKTYQQAMLNMNAIVDAKVQEAIQAATENASQLMSKQQQKQLLQTELPFAKDPAIGPIAETVFDRFLQKGKSVEEAIKGTAEYFSHMHKTASEYLSPNAPGSTSERRFSRTKQTTTDHTTNSGDWLSILNGKT